MKLKQAKILRDTAKKLIEQAELLEAGIDPGKCANGTYTNKKFNGCKICGGAVKVKCKLKKVDYVNSGACNKGSCPDFSPLNT